MNAINMVMHNTYFFITAVLIVLLLVATIYGVGREHYKKIAIRRVISLKNQINTRKGHSDLDGLKKVVTVYELMTHYGMSFDEVGLESGLIGIDGYVVLQKHALDSFHAGQKKVAAERHTIKDKLTKLTIGEVDELKNKGIDLALDLENLEKKISELAKEEESFKENFMPDGVGNTRQSPPFPA